MRLTTLLAAGLLVVVAGCTAPVGGPSPTASPTPTATPTDSPTPTDRIRPSPGPSTPRSPTETASTPGTSTTTTTPTGPIDVNVTLTNGDDRTYRVFVAVVREPFDGATATYADGSTASFPEAETVRQFRRANNDSRVANVTFGDTESTTALLSADAGANATTTLREAPSGATFVYFLYTEPFDPTQSTTDVIVCNGGTLGPVQFTVESGSQSFDSGCFQGTPTE